MSPASSPSTSAEHKDLGTHHLSLAQLPLALHHYTLALALLPPASPPSLAIPLHLNLSLTHLKIATSPHLALSHAVQALAFRAEGAQRERALFRAAQAEYALERWQAAKARFESMSVEGGTAKERNMWLGKVGRRLEESEGGVYDWDALVQGRGDKIADYINLNKLEIRQLNDGRGRGLVATKQIETGELIALVKQYAVCLSEELNTKDEATKEGALNKETGLVDSLTQIRLADKVLQKIKEDDPSSPLPHVASGLLYAGPSYPSPPVFDLRTLLPGNEVVLDTLSISTPEHHRIALSISYNSFTPRALPPVALAPSLSSSHPPSGLYLLPSLLNHSCLPNTSQTFFSHHSGSPLAIRARRTILPGEEITQSYCAGFDFDARRIFLAKHVGQEVLEKGCGCELCLAEAEDGDEAMARRRRLLGVVQSGEFSRAQPSRESVKSLENLVAALQKTYSDASVGGKWMPDLWEPYHLLSDHLSFLAFGSRSDGTDSALAQRSIEAEIDALRCLGVTFAGMGSPPSPPFAKLPLPPHEERAIGSCFVVASAYHTLERTEDAKAWVAEGRRVETVVFGTGAQDRAWKARWGGVAAEYGLAEYM